MCRWSKKHVRWIVGHVWVEYEVECEILVWVEYKE